MKWWAILAAILLFTGSTAIAQEATAEAEETMSCSELQLEDLTVTLREPQGSSKRPATLEISKAWREIDEEKRKFVLDHLKELLPKGAMKHVLKALVEGKQKIELPALKSCEDCDRGCAGAGGGRGGGKPCAGGGCGKNVTVRGAGRIALGGLVPPGGELFEPNKARLLRMLTEGDDGEEIEVEVEQEGVEAGDGVVRPRVRLKLRTNDPDAKLSDEEKEQIRKALSGVVDSGNLKKILMVLDRSGHVFPRYGEWGVPHVYQTPTPLKFWWSSPRGGVGAPCPGGCRKAGPDRGPCGCRKSECGPRSGACGGQKCGQQPRPGACGGQKCGQQPRPGACGGQKCGQQPRPGACGGQKCGQQPRPGACGCQSRTQMPRSGACGCQSRAQMPRPGACGCQGRAPMPRPGACGCGGQGARGHEGAILRALNTLTTEIAALRREIAGMRGAHAGVGVPMPKARPGRGIPVPPKAPVPPNFHVITEGGARKLNVTPHYRVQGVAPGQYRVAVQAAPAARQKEALQAEVKQVQDELKELRETMKKLAERLSELNK